MSTLGPVGDKVLRKKAYDYLLKLEDAHFSDGDRRDIETGVSNLMRQVSNCGTDRQDKVARVWDVYKAVKDAAWDILRSHGSVTSDNRPTYPAEWAELDRLLQGVRDEKIQSLQGLAPRECQEPDLSKRWKDMALCHPTEVEGIRLPSQSRISYSGHTEPGQRYLQRIAIQCDATIIGGITLDNIGREPEDGPFVSLFEGGGVESISCSMSEVRFNGLRLSCSVYSGLGHPDMTFNLDGTLNWGFLAEPEVLDGVPCSNAGIYFMFGELSECALSQPHTFEGRTFPAQSRVKSYRPRPGAERRVQEVTLMGGPRDSFQIGGMTLSGLTKITFHSNGEVARVESPGPIQVPQNLRSLEGYQECHTAEFDEKGNRTSCQLSNQ